MKSSSSSSATASPTSSAPTSGTPPRSAFALSGRSVTLDPRTHAVRPDLADMRLADRVFAPHYAEALPRRLASASPLRAAREAESDVLTTLATGEPFELLDLIGGDAWGVAPAHGLVGYLPADALAR